MLGSFQVAHEVLTGTAQVPNGFVLQAGNVDGVEIARAHETRQLYGIAPVGLHPIPRLTGNEGGGDHDAALPLLVKVAVQPVAAGTGFVDEQQVRSLGVEPPDEVVDVVLACADGAQIDCIRRPCLGHVGDCDGVLVDVQSDEKCGRLLHG